MDYEFWIRMYAKAKRFRHLNRVISAFRLHQNQKSRKKELLKERIDMKRKYYGITTKNRIDLTKYFFYKMKQILEIVYMPTIKTKNLTFPAKIDSLKKYYLDHIRRLIPGL